MKEQHAPSLMHAYEPHTLESYVQNPSMKHHKHPNSSTPLYTPHLVHTKSYTIHEPYAPSPAPSFDEGIASIKQDLLEIRKMVEESYALYPPINPKSTQKEPPTLESPMQDILDHLKKIENGEVPYLEASKWIGKVYTPWYHTHYSPPPPKIQNKSVTMLLAEEESPLLSHLEDSATNDILEDKCIMDGKDERKRNERKEESMREKESEKAITPKDTNQMATKEMKELCVPRENLERKDERKQECIPMLERTEKEIQIPISSMVELTLDLSIIYTNSLFVAVTIPFEEEGTQEGKHLREELISEKEQPTLSNFLEYGNFKTHTNPLLNLDESMNDDTMLIPSMNDVYELYASQPKTRSVSLDMLNLDASSSSCLVELSLVHEKYDDPYDALCVPCVDMEK